jgi:hypothetical protein
LAGWAGEKAAETGGYFKIGSCLGEGKETGPIWVRRQACGGDDSDKRGRNNRAPVDAQDAQVLSKIHTRSA